MSLYTKFEISGAYDPTSEEDVGPFQPINPVTFIPEPLLPMQVIGKEIIDFTCNGGSYGMGGPGFFGLELENSRWLMVALWGAADWLELGVRSLSKYDKKELESLLVRQKITDIRVERNSMEIVLSNQQKLILDKDPLTRSRLLGNGGLRKFKDHENLQEAVFVSPTPLLWV